MPDNFIKKTINKYKVYRYEKRLTRLEGDLKVLNKRISFNPYSVVKLDEEIDTSIKYSKRIEEYRVWYTGNAALIHEFYKTNFNRNNLNYFWARVRNERVKAHAGLASLISSAMAKVVFGSGYNANVSVYNEDSSKNDELSEKASNLVIGLTDALKLKSKLLEAAETESWSGGVFFKLSHNIEMSNFPILETATVREAELIEYRGITQAIVFKYYHTHKKIKYRLDEIYTQTRDRDAAIKYELYKMTEKGEEERVDLYSIPKMREYFLDENGNTTLDANDAIIYKGVKTMLAFYKPNKLPSHEFYGLGVGASDYEGAIDSFDAVDEVFSEMKSEVRNNKSIKHYPSTMLETFIDDNGNVHELKPDDFMTNYKIIPRNKLNPDIEEKIFVTEIPDKQESLESKYQKFLSNAINQAGLSPFALGITGLESINASAESQQERNKVTLETRSTKHELWKPFLEELLLAILSLNAWLRKELKAKQPFEDVLANYNNTDIDIEFNAYTYPKPEELLTTWGLAKQSGVASIKEAIRNIHPDWDAERIEEEVNLIRYEQGMSLDTPTLMQFPPEEPQKTIEEVVENE